MHKLDQRRRSGGDALTWLYREGVISPILGDFNTAGYCYNESHNYGSFSQSKEAGCLLLRAGNPNKYTGGRTFTSDNSISDSFIGKTLRVSGSISWTYYTTRASFVGVYLSEEVVNASGTENVDQSGAFVNAVSQKHQFSGPANTTENFDLMLPITQSGYISIMFYKGHTAAMEIRVDRVWIE